MRLLEMFLMEVLMVKKQNKTLISKRRTDMQELEKILEEIEQRKARAEKLIVKPPHDKLDQVANDTAETFIEAYKECQDIIRKHMNDGWIPVEERLPEVDEDTEETIEDDYCPEYIVTIRGASESTVLKYSPNGTWFDDNGNAYDVIAWRPLPESYRPKRREQC